MMPFFVKMKCRLMVPLTIFPSFEKGGEVYHNPHFAKHCDMENKFKSKIRRGMKWILYRWENLLALPIANRARFIGLADSRFDLFLFYPPFVVFRYFWNQTFGS